MSVFLGLAESGWQDLIHRAVLLKVGPFVYKNIKRFHERHPGVVPASVIKRLQGHYQANVAKNLKTNIELGRVCKILHQEGIPVILLKGSCLINGIYRDVGLRTMNDVDLLFRRADRSRAQALLAEQGYPAHGSRLDIDFHWTIDLDVHASGLIRPLGVDMEPLWQRCRKIKVSGQEACMLSHEDCILHLIIHSAHHHLFRGSGLRTLCDIQEYLLRYGDRIDWPCIWGQAGKWGITRAVMLTFTLAEELLGVAVPWELVPEPVVRPRDEMWTWAIERIFSMEKASSVSPFFLLFWTTTSLRDKMHLLHNLLFPPREAMLARGMADGVRGGHVLSYLSRIQRHGNQYLGYFCRMVRRDPQMLRELRQQRLEITMRKKLLSD